MHITRPPTQGVCRKLTRRSETTEATEPRQLPRRPAPPGRRHVLAFGSAHGKLLPGMIRPTASSTVTPIHAVEEAGAACLFLISAPPCCFLTFVHLVRS